MLIDKSTNNETISQIKLTHHNRMMGKIADGMPICTSVEIARGYDPRVRMMLWFKTVEHTYYSLDGNHQHTTNIIRTAVDNSDELLGKLTKINFKDLKNNYFTDAAPHKYSWWELNYNHCFYVVGTYDNLIDEIKAVSDVLGFGQAIQETEGKVREQIKSIGSMANMLNRNKD